MKTLVTGGAGFIGSNLVQRLINENHSVIVVDDLSNGQKEFLPKSPLVQFWKGDFGNISKNTICDEEIDVVFHLAALPRVSYSVEHPIETNEVNVTKTLSLLNECVKAKKDGNLKKIVFASSSSVYGGATELPTRETCQLNPKSPYALQKMIGEQYCRMYGQLYGLDSICLRFFNVFGPNQLGCSPYATAISSWLDAIHRGEPMRSDGDGTQSRDMCYVDNVTQACIKAALYSTPLYGEAFNVATGFSTTNNEILNILNDYYPGAKVKNAPWRAGDVYITKADISKAICILGYFPEVDVYEGIKRTIQWVENSTLFHHLKLSI
jgi:nucleoside-diphosphate-sugar epimerase